MADPAAFLNALPAAEARAALTRCCGATRWVEAMLRERPFASSELLEARALAIWDALGPEDWLEAFRHHPRIGENLEALRERFGTTATWASQEQAGALGASEGTLEALRDENRAYRERFGFIFIVCATGKSADEMLALLRARLHNTPDHELRVAAAEQAKITALRLGKLSP